MSYDQIGVGLYTLAVFLAGMIICYWVLEERNK